jgi:hypothetical protein
MLPIFVAEPVVALITARAFQILAEQRAN